MERPQRASGAVGLQAWLAGPSPLRKAPARDPRARRAQGRVPGGRGEERGPGGVPPPRWSDRGGGFTFNPALREPLGWGLQGPRVPVREWVPQLGGPGRQFQSSRSLSRSAGTEKTWTRSGWPRSSPEESGEAQPAGLLDRRRALSGSVCLTGLQADGQRLWWWMPQATGQGVCGLDWPCPALRGPGGSDLVSFPLCPRGFPDTPR